MSDKIREILEELFTKGFILAKTSDRALTEEEQLENRAIEFALTLIRAENKRQMMEWIGDDRKHSNYYPHGLWFKVEGYNIAKAEIRKKVEEGL